MHNDIRYNSFVFEWKEIIQFNNLTKQLRIVLRIVLNDFKKYETVIIVTIVNNCNILLLKRINLIDLTKILKLRKKKIRRS